LISFLVFSALARASTESGTSTIALTVAETAAVAGMRRGEGEKSLKIQQGSLY
jgi:hypothetical protein